MNEPYWFLICMKRRVMRIPRRRQYLKARGVRVRHTEAFKKEMKKLCKIASV